MGARSERFRQTNDDSLRSVISETRNGRYSISFDGADLHEVTIWFDAVEIDDRTIVFITKPGRGGPMKAGQIERGAFHPETERELEAIANGGGA